MSQAMAATTGGAVGLEGESMQSRDCVLQPAKAQLWILNKVGARGWKQKKKKKGVVGGDGGRMGAVGKQSILISTKMQHSFASGRGPGLSGGGGTGEVRREGAGAGARKVPGSPAAPPAQPAGGLGRRASTCQLVAFWSSQTWRAEERRRTRAE